LVSSGWKTFIVNQRDVVAASVACPSAVTLVEVKELQCRHGWSYGAKRYIHLVDRIQYAIRQNAHCFSTQALQVLLCFFRYTNLILVGRVAQSV
jgi:hypothetical protein